jgi:uncharacterized protein YcbK (DUF882 family)
MSWRWRYFTPEEVLSPDGLEQYSRGILLISPDLLDSLEALRTKLKHPLRVNHNGLHFRGYRSPHENYSIVGGEKYSYHMQGLAADVSCYQVPMETLIGTIRSMGKFRGIGVYNTFVHIDMRHSLTGAEVLWKG